MAGSQSIFFKLPKTGKEGFFVQYHDLPHFYDQLHHHPEFQLILILEGTGDLYLEDSITSFGPGDLFLVGSNQNHLFKSDPEYFKDDCPKKSRSISIFFDDRSLGEKFFDLSEMSTIRYLLKRASRGLHFSSKTSETIEPRLSGLINKSGFDKFVEILRILNKLSEADDYEYLAQNSRLHPPSDKESERVNNVINYILENYKEDIELETIADIAHYSKAAFCKFFKQRTRKTFSEFLNEVRISQACKMLRKTNLNISSIGYECGYNNISHFNRQFKKYTGLTPREYSQKFELSKEDPSRSTYNHLED
ncbi:AraC family transcriptional regulator [Aliifodinibius sp. S!AR15-10]|uniref:AraC family transcriptional regulator n=1 Tax=Aliifodinibius sp. S!AR15-10 TaxID=2950437 RepID=UPI0028653874|nr:AraC family transcriptional regulator [Aliifodinibius sp. S!AR15-10]MDR8390626.1 AraC family transcriptional regulator [Aliifodinibius sp. S!AR15-10]